MPRQAKQLSYEQKLFCIEFTRSGNPHEAALAAGLEPQQVNGLLRQINILKEVGRLRQENLKRAEANLHIDHRLVLNELWNLYLKTNSDNIKLKTLELIGKHLGFFAKDNEQLKPEFILNINNIDIAAIAKKLEESC